jgi:hypothetical protein
MAHCFRQVVGLPVITKEMLSQRTAGYQTWVEAFARNHRTPIHWTQKGVRKEDYVLPWLRRMVKKDAYGVYFIFKSMEVGPTFRITVPKYPSKDPNYRILANQWSRFTHYYFYIHDEVLGPIVMRVASSLQNPPTTSTATTSSSISSDTPRSASARTTTPLWRLMMSP